MRSDDNDVSIRDVYKLEKERHVAMGVSTSYKRWTKYSHAADKSLCQRTRDTVYIRGMDEDVLPAVCARVRSSSPVIQLRLSGKTCQIECGGLKRYRVLN